MADNEGAVVPDAAGEVDELAGSELFDIPADLMDDEPTEAPAKEPGADPAIAEPPADRTKAPKPRDETGKFVSPQDAAATEEGQPPEPPQADPSETAAEGAPAPDAEPEPELEFSFRGDGQTIQIKGSKVTKDGVFIPAQYMPDVQRLMSHGVTYQGSYKQRLYESKQELESTKAQVHENVEKADAVLRFYADLADRTEKGETDEHGRTPIEAWLEDFSRNRVKLEAQAELAAAKAFRERRAADVRLPEFEEDPAAAEAPAQDLEELLPKLTPHLTDRLQSIVRTDPEIRGLTGGEITRIRDSMVRPERIDQFYRKALADIPASESGLSYDIKAGQIVPMDDAIRQEFTYQARLILDARKAALELSNAQQRNGQNGSGNKIPPVVTVNGAPVQGKKGVQKTRADFKTREEFDRWFNSQEGDPTT